MNGLESLKKYLEDKFQNAKYEIHRPALNDGFWQLDVVVSEKQHVYIQWRAGYGFGITHNPEPYDYGSGPDEIKPDLESAIKRITELLLS